MSTTKAMQLFAHWHNGVFTDLELVSRLSELPRETLNQLPDEPTFAPPRKDFKGIKERALELKAAAERGETFSIFGGITREEVKRKAAEGSVAAQAILATDE